ncbi:DUF6381 family protein [Streptomyces bambusae]|uniref:DUF6381 family protein n=1 Tax=Streptomyces bambusae TaxID=1550616 RepID=UPI001CFE5B17|nr:DUF6381 family protein [Streptomyces bambusae]MCB5165365.1 DUF6381 family protein [Streptomyces bambusae]
MAAGEPGSRPDQLRAKAQELKDAAERATEPQERRRLQDKAERLLRQSEQERRLTEKGPDAL